MTPRFPLFIDLTGRPCVVFGGGEVGMRRTKVLLSFGARVRIFDPEPLDLPEGAEQEQRSYMFGDLDGAALAVAATDSRETNHQIGRDAARRGIPVSVADCAGESTFYFPAICEGGGLTAGVVSDGTDHEKTARAAAAIRKVLEDPAL